MSIVRDNLMTRPGYSPYCGSELCKERQEYPLRGQRWPRTKFNGEQFVCPKCNWVSEFPVEFIQEYKDKWNK
jgi:hypothetical protein